MSNKRPEYQSVGNDLIYYTCTNCKVRDEPMEEVPDAATHVCRYCRAYFHRHGTYEHV